MSSQYANELWVGGRGGPLKGGGAQQECTGVGTRQLDMQTTGTGGGGRPPEGEPSRMDRVLFLTG